MIYLYTALLYLLTPLVILRLLWRARRAPAYAQRWGERFGRYRALDLHDTIWIHAVSVGEVSAAVPLVRALRERYPHRPILMTTMTPTGSAQVRRLFGADVQHVYVPYDLPHAVQNFLNVVRPVIAVIMETELWPNLFRACAARAIPVVVANARLSARSAAGYRRIGALTRATLGAVDVIAAQSNEDAQRFRELLGMASRSMGSDSFEPQVAEQSTDGSQGNPRPLTTSPPPLTFPQIVITGSIKFDLQVPPDLREQAQALHASLGTERPVWIAASTHEGEEALVLDAHRAVCSVLPDALLILVPRHPERFARVRALCAQRGLALVTRSSHAPCTAETTVFLGDSMGELLLFYAVADLAFVGGSLVAHGGHNPLEAAALSVPILFGPHMFNFSAISRLLCHEQAAAQINDGAQLGEMVTALLRDAARRQAMGARGQRLVAANRGALARLLKIIAGYLTDAE